MKVLTFIRYASKAVSLQRIQDILAGIVNWLLLNLSYLVGDPAQLCTTQWLIFFNRCFFKRFMLRVGDLAGDGAEGRSFNF